MTRALPESASPSLSKVDANTDRGVSFDGFRSPAFFLDAFPKEVLDNVLRHFSLLPKVKDWVPHIPLESISGLYGVAGQLGKFMKTRFNTLYISSPFDSYVYNETRKWKDTKGSTLCTNNSDVARRFVQAGGGQSLLTVIVGFDIHDRDDGTEIADDFLSSCPNVRSLRVCDKRGVWVSRFAGQLEELSIITATPNVVRSCCNLRELSLSLDRDFVGSINIWEEIGSSLECLNLGFVYREGEEEKNKIAGELEKIKTQCRGLRRICMHGMFYLNEVISNLLASSQFHERK